MDIHGEVLALAGQLAGAEDAESGLLDRLCAAEERAFAARLLPGANEADYADALICAAAFSAAAGLLDGRVNAAEFQAGEVSFRTDESARADALRRRAERLLAPYAASGDFAFRGVRA